MIPEETGMDSSGGMEDLRELGSFVPRKGVLFTVTQEEMPTDTIYVSEKYGKEYDGDPVEKEVRRIRQVYICSIHPL